ncbi:MAG TPA: ABC transporter permease, partial [Planctomycetota bacterium]|nr:ABC transporter permease [Planctomycetota bacterium]
YVVFVEVMGARSFQPPDPAPPGPGDAPPTVTAMTLLRDHYRAHGPQVTALAMFVAMVPWHGFQEAVSRCATTVGENGNLIKKIAFPSELLPVYIVGYTLFNVVVGLLVFVAAARVSLGIWPTPGLLWMVPVIFLLQAIFTLGLGFLLAATTVFLRDLVQIVPMVMTIWFFMTPIVYWRVPDARFAWISDWNPMAHLVELYRTVFIFPPGLAPDVAEGSVPWRALGVFAAWAFVMLWLGLAVFRRKKYDFADEL